MVSDWSENIFIAPFYFFFLSRLTWKSGCMELIEMAEVITSG